MFNMDTKLKKLLQMHKPHKGNQLSKNQMHKPNKLKLLDFKRVTGINLSYTSMISLRRLKYRRISAMSSLNSKAGLIKKFKNLLPVSIMTLVKHVRKCSLTKKQLLLFLVIKMKESSKMPQLW